MIPFSFPQFRGICKTIFTFLAFASTRQHLYRYTYYNILSNLKLIHKPTIKFEKRKRFEVKVKRHTIA